MRRRERLSSKSSSKSSSTADLRRVLDELGAAKQSLLDATAALRAVDGRVRLWDLGEPFMARRSHALRAEATGPLRAARWTSCTRSCSTWRRRRACCRGAGRAAAC